MTRSCGGALKNIPLMRLTANGLRLTAKRLYIFAVSRRPFAVFRKRISSNQPTTPPHLADRSISGYTHERNMHGIKVDLLGGDAERKARRTTAFIAVIFAVSVGVLAAVGAGASYRAATHGTSVLDEVGNLPIIADIRRLAWGTPVAGTTEAIADDRLTFLIMGVGGTGHSGPELADTILIATADLKTHRIGIMSMPRDLAYPLGGGKFIKINSVNAYAEQSNPGQGARETADAFEELLGITIDHAVKINFNAFVDLIDAIDGIDVNVEKSFTDYEYPTEDEKWQTISFKEGKEHMDGQRALMYARSRHGNNGEGSDFARSRRQQIIMIAVKEKLLSMGTIANPSKLTKLYQAISSNLQTDLTPWDMIKLAPLLKNFSSDQITMRVLTNAGNGELTSQMVNGAYMLFPKKPDWSQIQDIAQHPFGEDGADIGTKATTPVRLEVRNGTLITGLASRASEELRIKGYLVETVGNATRRDYKQTMIIDLTQGAKANELAKLRTELNATVTTSATSTSDSTTSTPYEQHAADASQTDFLVILGENAQTQF